MRTIKFRWPDADGKPFFKEIPLPDGAQMFTGNYDRNGREVYENDPVRFSDQTNGGHLATFDDYRAIQEGGVIKCE